jgi:hypothetical protein
MGGGVPPTDAVGQIVTYLLSFGLPGVCLIVLGWAYWNKDKRVEQLQDTLIKMAGENATAMVSAANAINGNTAVVNSLRDMLISRSKTE